MCNLLPTFQNCFLLCTSGELVRATPTVGDQTRWVLPSKLKHFMRNTSCLVATRAHVLQVATDPVEVLQGACNSPGCRANVRVSEESMQLPDRKSVV